MTETAHPLSLWRRVPAWFVRHAHWIAIVTCLLLVAVYLTMRHPGFPAVGETIAPDGLRPDRLPVMIYLALGAILNVSLVVVIAKWRRWVAVVVLPISVYVTMLFIGPPFSYGYQALPPLQTEDTTYHFACLHSGNEGSQLPIVNADFCALLSCESATADSCAIVETVENVIVAEAVKIEQVNGTIQVIAPTTQRPIVEHVIPEVSDD